jgi:hypothetical protein
LRHHDLTLQAHTNSSRAARGFESARIGTLPVIAMLAVICRIDMRTHIHLRRLPDCTTTNINNMFH